MPYNHLPISRLFLVCSSLYLGQLQAAEPPAPAPIRLPTMVVTGSPTARNISSTTATVNLLERDQLKLTHADYVGDLLAIMPSVSVRNEGILGRQGINIRGLGSNCRRIQILVDGRPEKMSLFGCAVTQTLPLANVQRIELARGPESVLYGSDAMGGVINIITRKREVDGQEGQWLSSYGSHAHLHQQLGYGMKQGPFDLYLTYDKQKMNGFRPNSDYESDFASLRLGYQLDQHWEAAFNAQFFDDHGENPGPDYNPARHDDWQSYRRWFWNATLQADWDTSNFQLNAYQNYGKHHFHMPTYQDFWQSKDYTFGLSASYQNTLVDTQDLKYVLTAGYDYERQWAKPLDDYTDTIVAARKFYDFGPYRTQSHELFLHGEATLENLVNTTGVRAHWDDLRHRLEWIPQTAFRWQATPTTALRAKVSKGFRMPRFSETFLFPAHNEKLEPEEVWNYEASLIYDILPQRLQATATIFYMDVKDQVQTIKRPNQRPAKFNVNASPYSIEGLELELAGKPIEHLEMAINYTCTDVQDGELNKHANRDGVPKQALGAFVSYQWDKLTASIHGNFVKGLYSSNQIDSETIRQLDDFLVINLALSYQLNEHTRIFAGLDNLLDEDYEEYNGYPAPGLTATIGLELTF